MAAPAECVDEYQLTISGLPSPLVVILPRPWSDDELTVFSRMNRTYRIERNQKGELFVQTSSLNLSRRQMRDQALKPGWTCGSPATPN